MLYSAVVPAAVIMQSDDGRGRGGAGVGTRYASRETGSKAICTSAAMHRRRTAAAATPGMEGGRMVHTI